MDNYYFPREQQKIDAKGVKNFDLPQSIDLESFKLDLLKLQGGEKIVRTEYTFNNEMKESSEIEILPAKVIVVEGLFVFHDPELFDLINLKLIVHAPDSIKCIRRIKRDKVERNYPVEDVLYRYEHHVLPTYRRYIEPFLDDVDFIVNNHSNFHKALEVIKGHIENKLRG
jgi:uridine kinase